MTNKTKILGENTRPTKYNPDLAKQVARQAEIDEQRAKLEARTKKPVEEPLVNEESQDKLTNEEQAEYENRYVHVPALDLYISKERSFPQLNWQDTQEESHTRGKRMPTIPEFIEFVKYLRSPEGVTNVNDANKILEDILKMTNPWRGEFLDARFKTTQNEGIYILYHTFNMNGNITQQKEKLEPYLNIPIWQMPKIDLDSWLKDHTKQGLPKETTPHGYLDYWPPLAGGVGGFFADSNCIGFYGHWNPTQLNKKIGVRHVINPNKYWAERPV